MSHDRKKERNQDPLKKIEKMLEEELANDLEQELQETDEE